MRTLSIRRSPLHFTRRGRLLLCGLLLGGTLHTAWGQLPAASPPAPRRHSLSLEAQSVSNGGRSQVSSSSHGLLNSDYAVSRQSVSDTRVSKNKQFVEFTVKNFGNAPDEVTVEWYFVAAPVLGTVPSNKEYVFDRGSQALTVPATGVQTQTVASREAEVVATRATTFTQYGGSDYASGTTGVSTMNSQKGTALRGWFVRLLVDGKVVAARGSSQKYEDIGADDARTRAFAATAAPGGLPSRVSPLNRSRPNSPPPTGPAIPGFPVVPPQ